MNPKNPTKAQVNPLLRNHLNKNFRELAGLRRLNYKKNYKKRKVILKNQIKC